MQKKLLLLSFIEGAAVMAAELCGAKLLAPIYGGSLYVWASVMGITLMALALGYFYGGSLTQKKTKTSNQLFLILILASLTLLFMPVMAHYLVPRISYLSFLPAVIISTFCLLFPAVFFLGASSPLFIALQTNNIEASGKVSGTVYAISTFGGILATFACGFYFIPVWGLNRTMMLFGSLLFLATLLVQWRIKIATSILYLGGLYLNIQFAFGETNALITNDGILGHLEVKDVINENKDSVRIMKVNEIIQTEIRLSDHQSVSEYIHLLDTLINPEYSGGEALVLGLGGGPVANLLIEKGFNVTGVELDERIIDAAKSYFFMNEKIKTVCQDARYYINHCDEHFDLIVVDLFKAEEQPSHVLTIESIKVLKKHLNAGGTIYINWHGYTNEEFGKGTAVLYNTLALSGFNVRTVSNSQDQSHRNIIFVVNSKDFLTSYTYTGFNVCRVPDIPNRILPFEINDELPKISDCNTDDKPLLELYNAKANKLWRTNYLRYYQNK